MKIIVNEHRCILDRQPINEKEINITKCEFEFVDSITEDYVKEAYFTFNSKTYKQIIENNECSIPYEVLESVGEIEIGVVAYLTEDEEYIKRYNPKSVFINTWNGSLKDKYENSEKITPTDKEQMEQALQDGLNNINEAIEQANNLNIDANKVEDTTTITITKQDKTTKSVEVKDGLPGKDGIDGTDGSDGVSLDYNWNGTSLGIKREDEANYQYVNLKGDRGATGNDGADGYTPVRGTDYWTTSDISTIESHCDSYVDSKIGYVNQILATLTSPEESDN